MAIAQSRITAQNQISVPAEVRKKLGVGPGSLLVWEEVEDAVVVRRLGRTTTADIHRALFGKRPLALQAPSDPKESVREYIRAKHARD